MDAEMKIDLKQPTNGAIYGASLLSILLSLLLLRKSPVLATFTGLWVPSILGLGILLKENRLLELEKQHSRLGMGV